MRLVCTKPLLFLPHPDTFLPQVFANFAPLVPFGWVKAQVTQMAQGVFTIGDRVVYKTPSSDLSAGKKPPVLFQEITIRPRYV